MALSYDQITAITEKYFMPKLADNIFDSNPLFMRLRKKNETRDGGTSVMVPLNYAKNTAGGWYSGAETLNTADTQVITAAEYAWKQAYENITILRSDELKNSGDSAKVNFVRSKMEIAQKSFSDRFGTGVFSDGTTNTKSIPGLESFCSTSNTVGGISQSSYSWWQAQTDSSTTVLTIAQMQGMFGDCSLNNEQPDLIIVTQDVYDLYYKLLQPLENVGALFAEAA